MLSGASVLISFFRLANQVAILIELLQATEAMSLRKQTKLRCIRFIVDSRNSFADAAR